MRVLLVLLIAAVAAAGEKELDQRARALEEEYRALRGRGEDLDRRLQILRRLGGMEAPRAQAALLRAFRGARSMDDAVVALLSLGSHADDGMALQLTKLVARRPDPVLLEVLGDALAAAKGAQGFVAGAALEQSKPAVLRACIAAQRLPFGRDRLLRIYEEHAAGKGDFGVAHAAILALGRIGGEEAHAVFAKAARHEDWRIRLAAAEALPGLQALEGDLLEAARALSGDASATVRRTLAAAAGRAKCKALAGELVTLLEDPRLRTRHEAASALRAISGRDLGYDAAAWRRWAGGEGEVLGEPRAISFARYYGFSVFSDRVLFVIDCSGSMGWPWRRKPKRIEVAASQLERVLKGMSEKSLFNIALYSERVRAWRKEAVKATPGNVAKALRWAGKAMAAPAGSTDTRAALEAAFSLSPRLDTIFFLSDGAPTMGKLQSTEALLAAVRVWNRYRRVAVHTVGLSLESLDRGMPIIGENHREMKRLMRELASQNRGECGIFERPPPESAER